MLRNRLPLSKSRPQGERSVSEPTSLSDPRLSVVNPEIPLQSTTHRRHLGCGNRRRRSAPHPRGWGTFCQQSPELPNDRDELAPRHGDREIAEARVSCKPTLTVWGMYPPSRVGLGSLARFSQVASPSGRACLVAAALLCGAGPPALVWPAPSFPLLLRCVGLRQTPGR
jgi:hypothetical protein